jgi:CubicO group peptidase (beta-lactamase class C family)
MRRIVPAAIALALSLVLASGVSARQTPQGPPDLSSSAFESFLELLRQQAGIPGISGAILQDGRIVWERGLGFANQETRIRVTPDTPFPVGDLTQMFSAVLLLQCVEQRVLALDAPLQQFGTPATEPGTLRQILSHTGPDGLFRYDAARFAHLAAVMEHCAPQPFRKSVAHRLLERLAMIDSVPGRDMQTEGAVPEGLFEQATMSRYSRVLDKIAMPYRVDRRGRATRSDMTIEGINAATGLISTVRDLARFDLALDTHLLLREETRAAAWSPPPQANGQPGPRGLGWFVQNYRDTPVVWHFGLVPNSYSALIVKVPSRRATMILLANSDGLAVPFQLEAGDVTRSVFAALFLRMLL